MSRQKVKEKLLERFILDQPEDLLKMAAEDYASCRLSSFLKPQPLQKLNWHKSQGHRCILISASLELYLKPWAQSYGFEEVLASKLEWTSTGQATGKLSGLNCWGAEKVRRLIEYAGSKENYELFAYGDSRGDRELLDYSDFPHYRSF